MNASHPFLGGWLSDFGHGIGTAARGILDVSAKGLEAVVTRGGADSDTVVNTEAQGADYTQYLVPASLAGVAIIAAVMLAKKSKRKKRR